MFCLVGPRQSSAFANFDVGANFCAPRKKIFQAECFAKALATNTTLKSLMLRRNAVSAAAAHSLAGALGVNAALTELDLRHNFVGDDGARSMAAALEGNVTLRSLNLVS